jgi:hypothetical protein
MSRVEFASTKWLEIPIHIILRLAFECELSSFFDFLVLKKGLGDDDCWKAKAMRDHMGLLTIPWMVCWLGYVYPSYSLRILFSD